jgi:hypothetical protein
LPSYEIATSNRISEKFFPPSLAGCFLSLSKA